MTAVDVTHDPAMLPDPAEPHTWSHSRVNVWRRCPRKYHYRYIQKLKRKTPALPLKRGSWLHELIEVHYLGGDWEDRHDELTAKFMDLFEEEREEYGDLPGECSRIMRSYLSHYRREDAGLRVIDAELDEMLPLPNGDTFNFVIDLVVEDPDGGIWLWDHKTVGKFMPPEFMLIDAQLARYFWAAEFMGYGPLRGVMFNEIITTAPTVPEVLKSGELTRRANLRSDVFTYMRAIRENGLDMNDYRDVLMRLKASSDQWFRRTRLPRDTELMERLMDELYMAADEVRNAERNNAFPRTARKDCTWDCDFLDMCAVELMGGDASHIARTKFTTTREETE